MWLLSIAMASLAFIRGESLRVESIWSRSTTLFKTSCKETSSPLAISSLYRRSALVGADASRNILSSASGNTTVAISRPSITTPLFLPSFCCWLTNLVRTAEIAATGLTRAETSRVLICFSTLIPFKKTSATPVLSFFLKSIDMFCKAFSKAS